MILSDLTSLLEIIVNCEAEYINILKIITIFRSDDSTQRKKLTYFFMQSLLSQQIRY